MNTITVEELAQNGTEGLQLIDVRPENDFSHGAIEGAVNLPLEKIEAGKTAILKKISLFICTAMWVKTAVMQLKY